MVGQKNRIQVTGWHKRHDAFLRWVFENMPEGYQHLYADEEGNMNQSAMVRYCVEQYFHQMRGQAEKGSKE